MHATSTLCVALLLCGALGCSKSDSQSDAAASVRLSKTVGASGGTLGSVESDGVSIDVPAGALNADTAITIESRGSAPSEYQGLSPVFELEPAGSTFAIPITVSFLMESASDQASVFFTKPGSQEYEPLASILNGNIASAQVSHFSRGFAGLFGLRKDATVATSDASTPDASAMDATLGGGTGCPPAGIYTMLSFACGTRDITATLKAALGTTTLTFSSNGAECSALLTNSSSRCTESQEDVYNFSTGVRTSKGITVCNPAACTFTNNDAPCALGDRARPGSAAGLGFDVVNGRFTIRTPANTGDICGTEEGVQVFDLNPQASP